jgi:hypothetical protein
MPFPTIATGNATHTHSRLNGRFRATISIVARVLTRIFVDQVNSVSKPPLQITMEKNRTLRCPQSVV